MLVLKERLNTLFICGSGTKCCMYNSWRTKKAVIKRTVIDCLLGIGHLLQKKKSVSEAESL